MPGAAVTGEASVAGQYASGAVPEFRSGERDRLTAEIDARVRLQAVELHVSWGWVTDWIEAGETVTGPGDIRLGTTVRVLRRGPFDLGIGWEAKLPDARDEGEIGTDETDITVGAWSGWRRGPWAAQMGVGLAILGNPLRFANQDDVPLVRASLSWAPLSEERGVLAVIGRASLDAPTARNPVRAQGDVALRYGSRWFGVIHGGGGFVPAAADWHLGAAVGYSVGLPARDTGV